MNLLAIPSKPFDLVFNFSALLGDNLNWNSCIHSYYIISKTYQTEASSFPGYSCLRGQVYQGVMHEPIHAASNYLCQQRNELCFVNTKSVPKRDFNSCIFDEPRNAVKLTYRVNWGELKFKSIFKRSRYFRHLSILFKTFLRW
jgi:hypothetical protein